MLIHQDISENSEIQERKEFYFSDVNLRIREKSSVPLKTEMEKHTAEVLRQVKNSGVKEGGWVGGDAWFGSVQASVEVMKRFGVHSTFVIKNHSQLYPKNVLYQVLKARHGNKPAGHWTVMTTQVAGVDLIAIACAWSQSNAAHFISSCGKTDPHEIPHCSRYEDEWGMTQEKEIPRPRVLHFIYHYLSLIDEHNGQRQSLIKLEKRWVTKDVWFRLITTPLGQSVVDCHKMYRYWRLRIKGDEQKDVDAVKVVLFSDMICEALAPWPAKNRGRKRGGDSSDENTILRRIKDSDGGATRPLTPKQADKGKETGNSVTLTCYICRRYISSHTELPIQQTTSWWCKHCHMPLCSVDRSKEIPNKNGRTISCVQEHLCTDDGVFACNELHPKRKGAPKDKIIDNTPRRSKRSRHR